MLVLRTLALAAIAVGCPLAAETRTIAVPHGDLNLASDQGRATLDRRISGAVRQICGAPTLQNLTTDAAVRRCAAGARASTMAQIDVAMRLAKNPAQIATR